MREEVDVEGVVMGDEGARMHRRIAAGIGVSASGISVQKTRTAE
jgi:hypothetical protein